MRGSSKWPSVGKAPPPRLSHAVYINLDWDTKRRDYMNSQLAAVAAEASATGRNFTWERLSALPADIVKMNASFAAFRSRGFSRAPYPSMGKPGHEDWITAAVEQSHESIIDEIARNANTLQSRNEVWLILEDDAMVPRNLEAQWEKIWPFVPAEWDVMRLGWFGGTRCEASVNNRVHLAMWSDAPPHGPCEYCGTQGYVVNPQRASRVLQRLQNSKLYYIDNLLGAPTPPGEDAERVPPIAAFVPMPPIIHQNEHIASDRAAPDQGTVGPVRHRRMRHRHL